MTKPDSVARTIRIEASPEDVWEALTTAHGLENWFPIEADVTPGVGGRIRSKWDDTTWFEERIVRWEPGKILSTTGVDGGWAGISTEFHLQSDGAATVLRVVSSGFGPDDDWQEMLESFGLGWSFELNGLKHYLEGHKGSLRRIVRVSRVYTGSMERVWDQLVGPSGWMGNTGPTAPGPFEITTQTGERMQGEVIQVEPAKQLVARLDSWNGSLLRLQVLPESIGRTVTIWLSAFDVETPVLTELESRWSAFLDERTG